MREGEKVPNASGEVAGQSVHTLQEELVVMYSYPTEDAEVLAKRARLDEVLNRLLEQIYDDLKLKGLERQIKSIPKRYKLSKKARELFEEASVLLLVPASDFPTRPARPK